MYREQINRAYLQHIIDGAHRKSFDPYRQIDWKVPFDLSRFYLPPDMLSLYGTGLWERMTREEQVRLSMHEATSALATGIWFENLLSYKLMDYLIEVSPHDPHFYWMQIEVADECRHSMMFGEMIRHANVPWYKPRFANLFGFFTKYLTPKVSMMLGTLAAEAITDYLNRRVVQDTECHPAMRELSRIHIVEEARHLGYARQWLKENWPRLGRVQRAMAKRDALISASIICWQLVHPEVYRNAGLPPEAAKVARDNPNRARIKREMNAELVDFLREIDVIDEKIAPRWKAAGLMA